jgi:hypothetical protein
VALLRSWVQIPPGPFLSVLEIRYYFEIVFGYCRTNSAAMPLTDKRVRWYVLTYIRLPIDRNQIGTHKTKSATAYLPMRVNPYVVLLCFSFVCCLSSSLDVKESLHISHENLADTPGVDSSDLLLIEAAASLAAAPVPPP